MYVYSNGLLHRLSGALNYKHHWKSARAAFFVVCSVTGFSKYPCLFVRLSFRLSVCLFVRSFVRLFVLLFTSRFCILSIKLCFSCFAPSLLFTIWEHHETRPGTVTSWTKNLDFGGSDSSIIWILRGGIPRPMGFPGKFESSNLSRDKVSTAGRLGVPK